MARERGIVINISANPEAANQALAMVREQMQQTAAAAEGAGSSFARFGSEVEDGVPHMAAASAALRALRGDFNENMRAGERFLSMLPGMESLLQTAFPAVGALALGVALSQLAEKSYSAFENIVELKKALEDLGELDITIGKKLSSNADEIERSVEQVLEGTEGHTAALKQKLAYESSKKIDLSDLFYDKNFSGQKDNIKANYEDLYKSVAPGEAPEKIREIKSEIANLNAALQEAKAGDMGGFVRNVGGYGPTMLEDPEKYFKARIKAATDVEQMLSSEYDKRSAALQAIQTNINKPTKTPRLESDDRFSQAAAALAAEQARKAAADQKSTDQIYLSELDAQHKMVLVSDQEFFEQKLQHQLDEIDAEENALRQHQQSLQQLYQHQRSDKTLKRGSDGNSAEELKTQREILQTAEQIDALQGRRGQVTSAATAEANAANQAAELAGLRAAAELEKARNDGTTAQIALLQREMQLEVQKAAMAGEGDDTQRQIRELEQVEEQKLRIADVDRQIQQTEATFNTAAKEIEDRESKGAITKLQAEKQLNALHQQEVAVLQSLVQQYDALAATLGGPFVQKAQELHAALA
jgi:hypothetical protein